MSPELSINAIISTMNNTEVVTKCQQAREAAQKLGIASTRVKNLALEQMAAALMQNSAAIIEANKLDIEAGIRKGLSGALVDRLKLDETRLKAAAAGVREVKRLKDPIGEVLSQTKRPNGLKIKKIRVPLGVIGIIYEARPNVTVDSIALCLKSGNAVVLRGGSDAIQTNLVLARVMAEAAVEAGLPAGGIQLIENTRRESAEELMRARGLVDVLIPRGGRSLIQSVVENSRLPVIETGEGNCHAYVEKTADLKKALKIVINAKCQRPSVCNAIETLLVDKAIADKFLPLVTRELSARGVEIREGEEAWKTEFLDLIIAVKIVSGLDEAIYHINTYGTHHSETIITKDKNAAARFQAEVDSAAVYVNASTRFTDGFEFGFGAEIGISTQKLHARGPMGLPELTSYKYLIEGSGQVRSQ